MGLFNEQLKTRRDNDIQKITESCEELSDIINHGGVDEQRRYGNALYEICAHFGVRGGTMSSDQEDILTQIDQVFRPAGIMHRNVTLSGKWWRDLDGVLLTAKQDGGIVALIPDRMGRYFYYDYEKHERIRLTKKTAGLMESEAVAVYEPLPQKELGYRDIIRFLIRSISGWDVVMLLIAALGVSLLGMIMPAAVSLIFNVIVPSGQKLFIFTVSVLLVGAATATLLMQAFRNAYIARRQQKMKNRFRNALYSRILTLPVGFYKEQTPGDLSQRIMSGGELGSVMVSVVEGTVMAGMMTIFYAVQSIALAPGLMPAVLVMLALHVVTGLIVMFLNARQEDEEMQASSRVSGLIYSLFSGIQKIKVTGSEKRAYRKWAESYSEKADVIYNRSLILKLAAPADTEASPAPAIIPVFSVLGLLLIFIYAYQTVDTADFMSFSASYGLFGSSLVSLMTCISSVLTIRPLYRLISPILKEKPETREDKELVRSISGNVELSHVSFRYLKDGPLVLDDLNLKIRKGQYVAIVGQTGCGKSTLLRLLLGFETPEMGAVYYDSRNLVKLDTNSLRKHMGVVLQGGKLITDSIFSNIAITKPSLTMDEAWEAAELADVAEDIRNMPMKMNTMISEGGGGLSGGQKQRILIARAVAHKPSLLILDEATSALDNITQKKVADSLDKLKCTRIVVAHRLSTIRQCDRIIVLDKGRIVEDGSYEALIKKNGVFAELVRRQQIDGQ